MRKLVVSKKKKIKMFQNKKRKGIGLYRAAAFALACIMGSSMTVYAGDGQTGVAQSADQNITYVYHEHVGHAESGGGCYSVPVRHVHVGNVAEGGSCYQTPVYHSHSGDEVNGGPCYGTPVYHIHEGDEKVGGFCFEAVYHKHKSSCYEKILGEDDGCTIVKYEDTTDDDYEGHDYKNFYMSCGAVVHGINSSHYHSKMVCKLEGKITSYVLGCGFTTETIERYEMSCVKTEETIDSYQLSCSKTDQDIEYYELGCGRDEKVPVGKLIVTKKLTSNKKKANITVVYENMSEGEVVLSENPFTWYNEKGKVLGTGGKLQVTANGKYCVVMNVENEDVKKESLKTEIQVNNIKKEESGAGGDDSGGSSDSGDSDSDDGGESNKDADPAPTAAVMPTPTAASTATPQTLSVTDQTEESDEDTPPTIDNGQSNDNAKKIAEVKTPTPTPVWKVETKKVDLEKKESGKEEALAVEKVEQSRSDNSTNFFSLPAVKIITITAGTLLVLAVLGAFLYLLLCSVRIYNDDGEGNLNYIGRCMVRTQEDGYTVMITDAMVEKAVTNRYCLKSEIFHLGKREEEILVLRGERRVAVKIQKEMPVVI